MTIGDLSASRFAQCRLIYSGSQIGLSSFFLSIGVGGSEMELVCIAGASCFQVLYIMMRVVQNIISSNG